MGDARIDAARLDLMEASAERVGVFGGGALVLIREVRESWSECEKLRAALAEALVWGKCSQPFAFAALAEYDARALVGSAPLPESTKEP